MSEHPASAREQAAFWTTLLSEGPLSPAKKSEFDAWCAQSPENAAALQEVDLSLLSLAAVETTPELLAMRAAALERARHAARARWRRRLAPAPAFAIAAALLVCVIGAGAALLFTPQTYSTGIGERRLVALVDGSRISLDASSRVRVRFLGNARRLWLDRGRAKFDVTHDPSRPFSVTAADRTVIATGTSFSVELINRELRVVLYEGSVALLTPRTARPTPPMPPLSPGEELVANLASSLPVAATPIDRVRTRAWEGGQMFFDNEPVAIAVGRMNRYAQAPILLEPDLPETARISGAFNAADTDAFIDGLTALLPLRRVSSEFGVVLRWDESAPQRQSPSVEMPN